MIGAQVKSRRALGLAVALAGAVASSAACSGKKRQPVSDKGDALAPTDAGAKADDAAKPDAAEASAKPAWQRQSATIALDCDPPPEEKDTYSAALDAGRKAAAAKRWAAAVAAFRRAIVLRDKDPAAMSELSWALLQKGDAEEARQIGERAGAASAEPKLKAASLYNAGRAAEALGDLDGARKHYEASLALRESAAVKTRLAQLAAPAPRAVPRAQPMKDCQDQPSVEAACECLKKALAPEPGATASCQVTEPEAVAGEPKPKSERGKLVSVRAASAERDTLDSGETVVLLARRGATWSALQVVESAGEVDRAETPRTRNEIELGRYEELPFRGGTLFWVQTETQETDVAAGDEFVEGSAGLTLCAVPGDGAAGEPWCARLPLGKWDYSSPSFREDSGEGEQHCQVPVMTRYRVTLDDSGAGAVTLESGLDDLNLVGRFQL